MFERFTKKARRALTFAQEEARHLGHDCLGTEHLLLGLLDVDDSVAAKALADVGVDSELVRSRVPEILGEAGGAAHPGDAEVLATIGIDLEEVRSRIEESFGAGALDRTKSAIRSGAPFTPRGKKILELSLREALHRGDNYIGTEHLLLALVREGNGVAAQILTEAGVSADAVRAAVNERLSRAG